MLREYSLDSRLEMERWDEFVETHPGGTPYHTSRWLRVLEASYSFRPLLYAVERNGGEIREVFPLFRIPSAVGRARIVSLPFSDYGGPLTSDGTEASVCIHDILQQCADAARYVEVRGPIPEGCGFVRYDYYKRHVLSLLGGPEAVWKGLNRKTIQYSIRKAEKDGITVEDASTPEGTAEFLRLNFLTRKKHGVPSQPRSYFENLYQEVLSRGKGFILLATHEGRPVAGSLFLSLGRGLHYKYNASDPSVHGNMTPNHLLTWRAIERGCSDGYEFIDFGRTSPDNAGLMRYKAMWGATCMDVPYHYFPEIRGANATQESGLPFRLATAVWRRLPDALIERLGPRLYRHTG